MTEKGGAETAVGVCGPNMDPMQRENCDTDPPENHFKLCVISIFFCPFLGLLAILMSVVSQSRYNEGKYKRARDAARDAKFAAIFAIVAGVSIAVFFIWLYAIIPTF